MYTGPHIIKDGLVFGYDTGYGIADNNTTTRFYPGQPATNLVSAYNDNHVRSVSWTNSGTWVATYNASNRDKPVILGVDMSKCNLMHGETVTTGSQHFGCASVSVSASTTYTMSVYYLQNRAGASRPYFRTSVNNNNLGYLNYNGSTNTSNWPVNEWIRISVTVTVQSNENACYLSNYLGSQVGDQVWYCAPMVEQTSQLTTFVDGTRSSTASLIDLKETTDINVSNVSFDSTGQPDFDGSDDYGSITSFPHIWDDSVSIETVAMWHDNTRSVIFGNFNQGVGGHDINIEKLTSGNLRFYWDRGARDVVSSNNVVTTNGSSYHHCVFVRDEASNNFKFYVDGVLVSTVSNAGSGIASTGSTFRFGSDTRTGTTVHNGSIPILKVYNKALSSTEIKQNYNAYKNRFDI